MTLQELFDATLADETEARIRNTKTAVRVLAKALGYDSPADCPQEAYSKPLSTLYALVEHAQAGKGPHTIRNTKNYLSHLFRAAESQDACILPAPISKRLNTAQDFRNRVSRKGKKSFKQDGSYFLFRDWPDALKKEWDDYHTWATSPLVDGRPAKLRKRAVTMDMYLSAFQSFFGYLVHEKNLSPHDASFRLLSDTSLIKDYVHWHVNTKHERVTVAIHHTLNHLKLFFSQYCLRPDVVAELKDIHHSLPKPPAFYNKNDVWVSMDTIGEVGRALWPTCLPTDIKGSGAQYATQAALAVMIQLWRFIPYRQRNMREMLLEENLFKNAAGKWRIRFSGEQMKIEEKKGAENVFEMPFPAPLVGTLETYLRLWRPLLTHQSETQNNYVFLKQTGTPFGNTELCQRINQTFFAFTGKAVHPHLIRTIWATEYIQKTGNLMKTAIMLNDKLETVVANYAHLREQGVAEEVFAWVEQQTTPTDQKAA